MSTDREPLPNPCLCSDPEDRHGPDAAGPRRGKCLSPVCGCLYYREGPDAQDDRIPLLTAARWAAMTALAAREEGRAAS